MLTFKPGTSFFCQGKYTENDKITPKSLVGITLTSKFRDASDVILAVLTVTITNANLGLYTMSLEPTQTKDIPANQNIFWDIYQEKAGRICATDTVKIKVIPGISREN